MKYRRKPTTVEAFFYTGENTPDLRNWVQVNNLTDVVSWTRPFVTLRPSVFDGSQFLRSEPVTNAFDLTVRTVEGNTCLVPPGTYIVIDSKNFPYPCNAEHFHANYEQVHAHD